jgi:hypothetical protein
LKVSCTHCSIHYPFPIELFSLISPTISFLFFSDPFTHETIILKTQFMKLIRNQISAKFGMLFDFTNTQQLSWQRQRWRRHEDIQWEFLLYILFTFTETAVYCFSLEKERMKKKKRERDQGKIGRVNCFARELWAVSCEEKSHSTKKYLYRKEITSFDWKEERICYIQHST